MFPSTVTEWRTCGGTN